MIIYLAPTSPSESSDSPPTTLNTHICNNGKIFLRIIYFSYFMRMFKVVGGTILHTSKNLAVSILYFYKRHPCARPTEVIRARGPPAFASGVSARISSPTVHSGGDRRYLLPFFYIET